jgi:hypothetical protein
MESAANYNNIKWKTTQTVVGFEVFTALTMKNAVFWDVALCRSCDNLQPPAHACSSLADFSTLKMEAMLSSETSVHTRSAQRHIPEDGILQHRQLLPFCI